MNGEHVISSILWKEYRLQRTFWIAMAALVLFVQLVFALLPTIEPGELAFFTLNAAFLGTALYAAGCGAVLFAAEHEAGTFEFQRSLPVSAPRIAFGKVFFALISITAMLSILAVTAFLLVWLSAGWHQISIAAPRGDLGKLLWDISKFPIVIFGLAILEVFSWGCFFSMLMRRPLLAAILAMASTSLCFHLCMGLLEEFFWNERDVYFFTFFIPLRLLILAAVAAADVWLARRWFKEESLWAKWRDHAAEQSPEHALVPLAEAKRTAYSRGNVFTHLLWQQIRQNGWIVLALTCLLLPLSFFLLFELDRTITRYHSWELREFMGFYMCVLVIGIPLWSMMFFHADQARRDFRFMTERGVSPNMVWLSRQALGILPLIIAGLIYFIFITVILFAAIYHNIYDLQRLHTQELTEFFFVSALSGLWILPLFLVYGVVQFCSLFFRSGILSGFFCLVFTALMMLWVRLMFFWGVPWWWSIAPLPFLLLLATWLRMPGWLLECNSLRAWARPATALVLIGAIILAVPFYRVYSVPWVDSGISAKDYIYAPTSEAQATLRLYEQAWNEYVPYPEKPPTVATLEKEEESKSKSPVWASPPPLTAEEQTWVASNTKAIQLTIQASQEAQCEIPREAKWGTKVATKAASKLCELLIYRARQLEEEGRPAEARKHYSAALRIADSFQDYYLTYERREEVYRQLPFWASGKETTPEQIQLAIEEMKNRPPDIIPLRKDLIRQYSSMIDLLQGKEDLHRTYFVGEEKFTSDPGFCLWRRFLPWERVRAERMLTLQLRYILGDLGFADKYIAQNKAIPWGLTISHDDYPYEPPLALRTRVVLPGYISFKTEYVTGEYIRHVIRYRATLIELALVSWKKTHGEYPSNLEQIEKILGCEAPMDPCSGRPFRYLAQGISSPLRIYNYGRGEECILEAGHPFLWSTGNKIEYTGNEPVLIHWDKTNHIWQNRYIYNEQELYAYGIAFPLP